MKQILSFVLAIIALATFETASAQKSPKKKATQKSVKSATSKAEETYVKKQQQEQFNADMKKLKTVKPEQTN